jgi:hypothetical protein
MAALGMSFTMPSGIVTEKIQGDSYKWACDYPSGFFDIEVSVEKSPDGHDIGLWGKTFVEGVIAKGYKATFIKAYEMPQASAEVGRVSATDDIQDITFYAFDRGGYFIQITIAYADKSKLTVESWKVVSAFLKSFTFS